MLLSNGVRGLLPNGFCWVADVVHRAVSAAEELSSIKYGNVNRNFIGGESPWSCDIETGQTYNIYDPRIFGIRQEIEYWMNRLAVLLD